jgi:hypothetical protein
MDSGPVPTRAMDSVPQRWLRRLHHSSFWAPAAPARSPTRDASSSRRSLRAPSAPRPSPCRRTGTPTTGERCACAPIQHSIANRCSANASVPNNCQSLKTGLDLENSRVLPALEIGKSIRCLTLLPEPRFGRAVLAGYYRHSFVATHVWFQVQHLPPGRLLPRRWNSQVYPDRCRQDLQRASPPVVRAPRSPVH